MSQISFGQWIGNKDVPSLDAATIEVENPTDQSILGTVPAGCAADADAALALAKDDQPTWVKVPSSGRAKVITQLATVARECREELIDSLCAEQAKARELATVEVGESATSASSPRLFSAARETPDLVGPRSPPQTAWPSTWSGTPPWPTPTKGRSSSPT